ncbi:MAG: PASTA domain-containing protein, partial [Thermodesulfobacteriota bacterium]
AEKEAELKALKSELTSIPSDGEKLNKLEKIKNRIFAVRGEIAKLDHEIVDLKLRVKPPVINLEGAFNTVKTGYSLSNEEGKPTRSTMFSDIPRRIVPGEPFEVAMEVRSFSGSGEVTSAEHYNYLVTLFSVGPVRLRLKKLSAECEGYAYGSINVRVKFTPTKIIYREHLTEYYYSAKIETKALTKESKTDLSQPLFLLHYWMKPSEDDLYDMEAINDYSSVQDWLGQKATLHKNRIEINNPSVNNERGKALFTLRPHVKGESFFPGALPGYAHPGRLASRPTNCIDRTVESVQVPDLVGLQSGVAKEHIKRVKLKHTLRSGGPAPDPRDFGKVASQEPPEGHFINKGGSITLKIYSKYIKTIEVPELTGLSSKKAKELLSSVGLTGKTKPGTKARRPEDSGKVKDQSPSSGSYVKKGGSVELTVFMPYVERRRVPNLAKMSILKAERELESQGLKLVELSEYGPPAPSSYLSSKIWKQEPEFGTNVKPGARVEVTLYAPFIQKVAVPDLFGMKYYEARNKLEARGLVASRDTVGDAPTRLKSDIVIGLKPEVGKELKVGDIVTVKTYGKFIPPPPPPPPIQQTNQGSGSSGGGGGNKQSPAECESTYASIRKAVSQGNNTSKTMASFTAIAAVAAGCDPGRVNQALTGRGGTTGGSNGGGGSTGGGSRTCRWIEGGGANPFGASESYGWDCTCDVQKINGEHYCGGKPYPKEDSQSTGGGSNRNRVPGVNCKWEDVPIQVFGMEGANPWTCMCESGDPVEGQCGPKPKWP